MSNVSGKQNKCPLSSFLSSLFYVPLVTSLSLCYVFSFFLEICLFFCANMVRSRKGSLRHSILDNNSIRRRFICYINSNLWCCLSVLLLVVLLLEDLRGYVHVSRSADERNNFFFNGNVDTNDGLHFQEEKKSSVLLLGVNADCTSVNPEAMELSGEAKYTSFKKCDSLSDSKYCFATIELMGGKGGVTFGACLPIDCKQEELEDIFSEICALPTCADQEDERLKAFCSAVQATLCRPEDRRQYGNNLKLTCEDKTEQMNIHGRSVFYNDSNNSQSETSKIPPKEPRHNKYDENNFSSFDGSSAGEMRRLFDREEDDKMHSYGDNKNKFHTEFEINSENNQTSNSKREGKTYVNQIGNPKGSEYFDNHDTENKPNALSDNTEEKENKEKRSAEVYKKKEDEREPEEKKEKNEIVNAKKKEEMTTSERNKKENEEYKSNGIKYNANITEQGRKSNNNNHRMHTTNEKNKIDSSVAAATESKSIKFDEEGESREAKEKATVGSLYDFRGKKDVVVDKNEMEGVLACGASVMQRPELIELSGGVGEVGVYDDCVNAAGCQYCLLKYLGVLDSGKCLPDICTERSYIGMAKFICQKMDNCMNYINMINPQDCFVTKLLGCGGDTPLPIKTERLLTLNNYNNNNKDEKEARKILKNSTHANKIEEDNNNYNSDDEDAADDYDMITDSDAIDTYIPIYTLINDYKNYLKQTQTDLTVSTLARSLLTILLLKHRKKAIVNTMSNTVYTYTNNNIPSNHYDEKYGNNTSQVEEQTNEKQKQKSKNILERDLIGEDGSKTNSSDNNDSYNFIRRSLDDSYAHEKIKNLSIGKNLNRILSESNEEIYLVHKPSLRSNSDEYVKSSHNNIDYYSYNNSTNNNALYFLSLYNGKNNAYTNAHNNDTEEQEEDEGESKNKGRIKIITNKKHLHNPDHSDTIPFILRAGLSVIHKKGKQKNAYKNLMGLMSIRANLTNRYAFTRDLSVMVNCDYSIPDKDAGFYFMCGIVSLSLLLVLLAAYFRPEYVRMLQGRNNNNNYNNDRIVSSNNINNNNDEIEQSGKKSIGGEESNKDTKAMGTSLLSSSTASSSYSSNNREISDKNDRQKLLHNDVSGEDHLNDITNNNINSNRNRPGRATAAKRISMSIVSCFSPHANLKNIMCVPRNELSCLDGMRVLSMGWIMLGHTYAFLAGVSTVKNPQIVLDLLSRVSFQLVVAGYFAVDSFFFLSGFLLACGIIRESHKLQGGRLPVLSVILHRYIRLTVAYAFVIGLVYWVVPLLGDGPHWPEFINLARNGMFRGTMKYGGCRKMWWTNILYINNVYPFDGGFECIGWGWYLANDFQFFLVGLVVLCVYVNYKKIGWACIILLNLVCWGISAFIVLKYDLHASIFSVFMGGDRDFIHNADDIGGTNMIGFHHFYVKPYVRISPHLIGLACGILYVNHLDAVRNFMRNKLNRIVRSIIHLFVFATMCFIVFITVTVNRRKPVKWTQTEDVLYMAFTRGIWALGMSWQLMSFLSGSLVYLNAFLSHKFWSPFSRLSYGAYLLHPIVMIYYFSSKRISDYITDTQIVIYFTAFVVLSYVASLVMSLLIESPSLKLEKLLFNKTKIQQREAGLGGTGGERERVGESGSRNFTLQTANQDYQNEGETPQILVNSTDQKLKKKRGEVTQQEN